MCTPRRLSLNYSYRLHKEYIEFVLFGLLLNLPGMVCIGFDPLKDCKFLPDMVCTELNLVMN